MFLLAVLLTVALVLETLPSAVVALGRAKVGLTRIDQLTRLGVLEGRNLWVVTLLGVLHAVGTAAVLIGLDFPVVGVAGAAIEAAIFIWVLYRQIRAGDRGRALCAYTLFTAMALAVLVVNLLRL